MADQLVALAAAVQDIRLMRVCQLAATFVALYDHALTIDLEVELIWKKRWSLAKILFAVNRYLGSAVLILETARQFSL
ncbi:hypothetical protein JAAARDRAFT_30943 [Jaapia argillacea MUCL 33604]|uniref:DUF6533 domain-containing protein n=1 Tax=Jaapia argillacea MUCL 33604 TaxID=933084 RepID=A0A067Q364_9AGAM|nr:hypothetical protein JAAARDRAFT_30943 [Jaapia argillacea MUCL 33604]